jgi:KipI family sensor histidine kinase inhibitor
MSPAPRLLEAGDAALTVEFGNAIDPALLAAVQALDQAVAALQAAGELPGLIEAVPTFRSLTLLFDPLLTDHAALAAALAPLLDAAAPAPARRARRWRLPACYEGEHAPDLAEVARATALSPDEVVARHSATRFKVYMLGFLPGFPFMGDLPEALRLPRRAEPRLRVPAGSVAIATGLSAIYPWESPGGWHLLARCPVPLFDATRAAPALLAAGDEVCFEAIATAEYARLDAALRGSELDPATLLSPEDAA